MADRVCAVDDCDMKVYCRGWCKKHYMRWQRHGDVTVVKPSWNWGPKNGRWKETPGFNAAHLRIKKRKGAAADHRCVDCGDQAAHWSYDYLDPNEIEGTRAVMGGGRVACNYSLDVKHYKPRCAACHSLHDARHPRSRIKR